MMTKVIEVEEMNPFANERTCHNGGGYFQPRWVVEVKDGAETYTVSYEDSSCGDFFTHEILKIYAPDGSVYRRWTDTRRENWRRDEPDYYDDIPDKYADVIAEAWAAGMEAYEKLHEVKAV